jgi:hypothetical protein
MQPLRNRRPLPGSRRFDAVSGPATVVIGTREGMRWMRNRNPANYIAAPIDLDPAAVAWPVLGGHLIVLEMGAPAEFVLRLIQALLADGADSIVRIGDAHRTQLHTRAPECSR